MMPLKGDLRGDVMKVKPRVRRGAEMLRKVDAKWYKKVDIEKLNMASQCDCILGQVFGDFAKGVNRFGFQFTMDMTTDASYNGFDVDFFDGAEEKEALRQEWIKLINRLRSER